MMFGALFWSSLEFGEKTLQLSVKIFFFFGLHLNLGEKTLQLFQLSEKTFFLVFASFAYLKKKIVVVAHPLNVENRAKLG